MGKNSKKISIISLCTINILVNLPIYSCRAKPFTDLNGNSHYNSSLYRNISHYNNNNNSLPFQEEFVYTKVNRRLEASSVAQRDKRTHPVPVTSGYGSKLARPETDNTFINRNSNSTKNPYQNFQFQPSPLQSVGIIQGNIDPGAQSQSGGGGPFVSNNDREKELFTYQSFDNLHSTRHGQQTLYNSAIQMPLPDKSQSQDQSITVSATLGNFQGDFSSSKSNDLNFNNEFVYGTNANNNKAKKKRKKASVISSRQENAHQSGGVHNNNNNQIVHETGLASELSPPPLAIPLPIHSQEPVKSFYGIPAAASGTMMVMHNHNQYANSHHNTQHQHQNEQHQHHQEMSHNQVQHAYGHEKPHMMENHEAHEEKHHHHHHKEEKEEKELIDVENKVFTKTIVGTKALKKGSILVVFFLFVVVAIIGLISAAGFTLSPISFPLALLPVGLIAFALFIPLLIAAIPFVAAGLGGKRKKRSINTPSDFNFNYNQNINTTNSFMDKSNENDLELRLERELFSHFIENKLDCLISKLSLT